MRVQVNVNDDLVSEIDRVAHSIGISRSSLCSYFIGLGMYGLSTGTSAIKASASSLDSNQASIILDKLG